ncbi:MAG: hypothetical protein BGO25_05745 [Acidobacteriales bacterium 59-55]|nr:hypothetical protein [Terriglobales bacterium]ODU54626.1 MAG: hypothetical protein ABT04_02525 [Granulicella sp. SCN 62-9]OJV44586.1 MAG: hypothetical protein BGO25_05745 [Acidobacteriales bacterium 59-55]
MNSIHEAAHERQLDPVLKELVSEAAANLRARHRGEASPAPEPLPKHIYEGPKYDGKQCAVCQRHFKSSAEYVTCRLCKSVVCRRKGNCKSLHHADHRLVLKRSQEGTA